MQNIKKRPWNRVDLPVYSVSSTFNNMHNMNICTYVTQVSMKPKRFLVAIYKGTKTLENIQSNPQFILQILSTLHIGLVRRLGKTSGHNRDKLKGLQKRLADHNGYKIIRDVVAIIEMKVLSLEDGGDHFMAFCDVVSYKNIAETDVLMLSHLRDTGIISV